MPRSNSSDAIGGRALPLPPPHHMSYGFNPKSEYDENDDALGETDSYSLHAHGEDLTQTKPEPETGPSSGTGNKRKRPLKLTPSQRERKRAIDREAQRSIRIKTKNYIAHLENLVKVMEQSDTIGADGENSRTRELMNQLKQSQDEVRSLREAMLSVQRTLSTVLGDSSALSIDTARHSSHSASPPSVVEAQSSTSYSAPLQFPQQTATAPIAAPQPPLQRQPSAASIPTTSAPTEQLSSVQNQTLPERPNLNPTRPRMEGELFYYAESHLNRVYAAGPAAFGNSALDEDIPVRAVIEGWASVEEHHELDLAWEVIREIDQTIWFDCGIVERMAIIRFMRTKLIYQVNARSAAPLPIMPAFMTQEVVKHARHADIIDHFIWPGFRHVLVEQPQKYISNYFSDKFRYNLKFLWPYGISNAYTKDPVTQTYSSTAEFMSRQWDIRCWTMRRRFFAGSEELISSIPTFDVPLHKSLSLGPTQAMRMPTSAGHGHRVVEEQEVDESEVLDSVVPVVGDQHAMAAGVGTSHAGGAGDLGATWHSVSPDQNIQQFWSLTPSNGTGMDHTFHNMAGHVGTGYPM